VSIKKWAKLAESYNPSMVGTDLTVITKQLEELSSKLERIQLSTLTPEPRKNVQF